MNKIFVCFTCRKDQVMLDSQFKALRKCLPDAKVYYVYEEAEKEFAQAPVGSFVLTADFPHNGNLIGLQCHYGMLSVMKQLSEMNDNANVVKIDSDCYFINDGWLDGLGEEYEMVGVAPGHGYFCKGTCYGITLNCIKKVMEYCGNDYVDLTGRIEDGTITMISAIVSEPNKVKIHNPMNADKSKVTCCIFQSGYYTQADKLKIVEGYIDCGDSKYTNAYSESNLPIPLAKARALEFLFNFFQNTSEKDRTSV